MIEYHGNSKKKRKDKKAFHNISNYKYKHYRIHLHVALSIRCLKSAPRPVPLGQVAYTFSVRFTPIKFVKISLGTKMSFITIYELNPDT